LETAEVCGREPHRFDQIWHRAPVRDV